MKKVFVLLMVFLTIATFIPAQDQTAPSSSTTTQTTDNQTTGSGQDQTAPAAGSTAQTTDNQTTGSGETTTTTSSTGTGDQTSGTSQGSTQTPTASVMRQRISDLIGYSIVNSSGNKIGDIKNFIITSDGKVPYATAKLNDVKSDGDIIVPIQAFKFGSTGRNQKSAALSVDVTQLQGAPVVKDNKLGADYAQQVNSFWSGKVQGLNANETSSSGQAYLASQILDYNVANTQGDRLGKVKDMMLNLENDQIAYVALGAGGFLGIGEKLFAVPMSDFNVDTNKKDLVLNVNKNFFDDAKGFDNNSWPAEASANWQQDVQSQKQALGSGNTTGSTGSSTGSTGTSGSNDTTGTTGSTSSSTTGSGDTTGTTGTSSTTNNGTSGTSSTDTTNSTTGSGTTGTK